MIFSYQCSIVCRYLQRLPTFRAAADCLEWEFIVKWAWMRRKSSTVLIWELHWFMTMFVSMQVVIPAISQICLITISAGRSEKLSQHGSRSFEFSWVVAFNYCLLSAVSEPSILNRPLKATERNMPTCRSTDWHKFDSGMSRWCSAFQPELFGDLLCVKGPGSVN